MKTLAFSSLSCKYLDDILSLAKENYYKAIEWDLNFIPPTISKKRLDYITDYIHNESIQISVHLPYSYIEIAHSDLEFQEYSVSVIKEYLKFASKLGSIHAIIHVGACENSNDTIALESLEELSRMAFNCGIKLCLENSIYGLTENGAFLREALRISNLFLCLDTGHCNVVSQNNTSYLQMLQTLMNKCVHSHIYKTEDEKYNHIPFNSLDELIDSKVMNILLKSNCNWFTMELDNYINQVSQKTIVEDFFIYNQKL